MLPIHWMGLIAKLNVKTITLQKIDLLNYNEASPGYLAEIEKEGQVLWLKKVTSSH
jgi:hypothetical protein